MTLRLARVSVNYGPALALADVDLEVRAGERLAVLGPSGSGKSTLLRAVAGLEPLSAGSITWEGADLVALPAHRRGFGLMFQDYVLFPHRDVRGNVAFGLEMRGDALAAVNARVTEVLELVGLPGYERRSVSELSGGEQQRVALARALAPTPRLLMLDEPLGALDRTLRTRLLDELAGLFAALRLPIIYVTHDQEEALAVGDRVAVLRAGRLEAVLPPQELWNSPPNEFVARFLGLANICAADVDGTRAVTPWGTVELPAALPAAVYRLLIRPEAIEFDPAGPIEALVEARTFRGDHTKLVLRTAGPDAPPLEMHATLPDAPAVGQRLRLRVAPAGIVVLPQAVP